MGHWALVSDGLRALCLVKQLVRLSVAYYVYVILVKTCAHVYIMHLSLLRAGYFISPHKSNT